ncbi:OprO/OprP family phosphate-selective porin [Thermodesulfobacteriota bacterium]
MKHIIAIFAFSFGLCFLICIPCMDARAASPESEAEASYYEQWRQWTEEGVRGPGETHYYWKDGFHVDRPKKDITLTFNLSVMVDGGYIGADDELESSFNDLAGSKLDFRQFRLATLGTLGDWADFKLDIDFANVRDIKDEWIRLKKLPFIRFITLGYMKEPFSLSSWTSLKSIPFMERPLSSDAFSPGRNFGIRRHTAALDGRMTWALGFFLNTGSFGTVGASKDQISDANGFNLTGRVTYLPWYEENGERVLHLGLSYSHLFRDTADTGNPEQYRARPESRLTDDRLVDTGQFPSKGAHLINPEFAMVKGPLSFQGEFTSVVEDGEELGHLHLWGFYLGCSYFLTGEYKHYGRRSGTFFRLEPNQDFRFRGEGWGALELALRFSFIDLNDEGIRGGKERNLTAGLNWYLTKKTRFMFNYINARVKDRLTPPAVEDGRANILQARFQIEF